MQGRNRNPYSNDGRGYNSNYRNFNRSSSGSFGRNKPYLPPPPPPRRKEEILMHAGRLAAEYLVYKGLLPPEVLTSKRHNGEYQDFKGRNRDFPVPDGRTSALNRLGSLNSDMGYGRRRYGDDYNDRMGPRDQFRGKKRMSPYGREYGSDWGRENGRWMGRNRGFNDMEDEDDFAPGYSRDRRSGFDQLPSRSENTMESGSENHEIVEDTGSKASSSSTRKELDGDLSKAVADDGKAINQEAGDEAKSNALVEESDVQPSETEGDSKDGDDLKKLCSFASVPTKPRSSSAQRSPKKDQELTAEASITAEGSSVEDNEGDGLKELPTDQTGMKSQEPENLEITADQPVVESNQQQELSQNPQGFGSSTIGEIEESNKKEGVKRQRESSSGDEPSRMHNVRAKQSSPEIEKPLIDKEQIHVSDAIEGITVTNQKNYHGHIRRLPPSREIQKSEIKYGLCVDALVNDAWWEGVVIDHAEDSKECLIFFPDQGDQQIVNIDNLRLTQEWNEVSGHWRPRGEGVFLQVLQSFNEDEELPVSVRQIWFDLRATDAFSEKIEVWIFGSQSTWHMLVSELIQELRTVVLGGSFYKQLIDISQKASRIYENNFGRKNSSTAEPWKPINLKAAYYPEAVMICVNEEGINGKKVYCKVSNVVEKARKHLLALGWKIETRQTETIVIQSGSRSKEMMSFRLLI